MREKQKKMNKEINLKGKKGITLIALIITIIVLLILAGVIIATLTGDNGLLTKAGEAKNKNAYSKTKEQVLIVMNEYKIDYQIGNIKDDASIINWLENQKNKIKSIDDFSFDNELKIIGLKKDGYTFYFNSDGSPAEVYNIEYELNGGTNEENAVSSYTKGQTVQLPVPTKEGAEFLGWSTKSDNNDSENIISAITGNMEGNIKLYAYWIAETSKDYFEFTPNSDGTTATITGFSVLGNQKYEAGEIQDLVLPNKNKEGLVVNTIGYNAFKDKANIKKIVIPDSVISIVGYTFANCTELEYLKIPISIFSINMFDNVLKVKEVYFSKGSSVCPDYDYADRYKKTPWYQSRENLKKITLEKEIINIGNCMFRDCSNIILEVN